MLYIYTLYYIHHTIYTLIIVIIIINNDNNKYIYISRYSIIKSFGFESIPQQLNTNVIRGLVKRAKLL